MRIANTTKIPDDTNLPIDTLSFREAIDQLCELVSPLPVDKCRELILLLKRLETLYALARSPDSREQ
jgi:hypothetical protein